MPRHVKNKLRTHWLSKTEPSKLCLYLSHLDWKMANDLWQRTFLALKIVMMFQSFTNGLCFNISQLLFVVTTEEADIRMIWVIYINTTKLSGNKVVKACIFWIRKTACIFCETPKLPGPLFFLFSNKKSRSRDEEKLAFWFKFYFSEEKQNFKLINPFFGVPL